MNRKVFLKNLLALLPATFIPMHMNALNKWINSLETTQKLPTLFLGHGSPMNAIEENEFVKGFREVSSTIESPKAILCISAHWETKGTQVTAMEKPRTIHDFAGFPKALYEVQYNAPGSPELAKETKNMVKTTDVLLDNHWGLDHGTWSVIKHLYPHADIPVIQLSLNYNMTPKQHYELGKELNKLRNKGVLIVGSGNMVHNLRKVDWQRLNENFAFDWAEEANAKMNKLIEQGNHNALINFKKQGKAFDLAIPTPEHFLPLLYILALQDKNDKVSFFNNEPVAGSLSMTSIKIY